MDETAVFEGFCILISPISIDSYARLAVSSFKLFTCVLPSNIACALHLMHSLLDDLINTPAFPTSLLQADERR